MCRRSRAVLKNHSGNLLFCQIKRKKRHLSFPAPVFQPGILRHLLCLHTICGNAGRHLFRMAAGFPIKSHADLTGGAGTCQHGQSFHSFFPQAANQRTAASVVKVSHLFDAVLVLPASHITYSLKNPGSFIFFCTRPHFLRRSAEWRTGIIFPIITAQIFFTIFPESRIELQTVRRNYRRMGKACLIRHLKEIRGYQIIPTFSGIYEQSLDSIKDIASNIVILEHVTDVDFSGFELIKQKKYGDKFITFLRK